MVLRVAVERHGRRREPGLGLLLRVRAGAGIVLDDKRYFDLYDRAAVAQHDSGLTCFLEGMAKTDVNIQGLLCDQPGTSRLRSSSSSGLRFHSMLHIAVLVIALGWTRQCQAQPPDVFAQWNPAWMTRAAEKLMDLALAAARDVAASRGEGYRTFAHSVFADVAYQVGARQDVEVAHMLTEAEKEWVVYMEEAALIDYLEGHFPASTRQLWDHFSTGGSFRDQLPVTEGMIHEDLPRFFQLRQWTDALGRMMPARTHFTTERRQQQWHTGRLGPRCTAPECAYTGAPPWQR